MKDLANYDRQQFISRNIAKAKTLGANVVTLKEKGIQPMEFATIAAKAGLIVEVNGRTVKMAIAH